MKNRILYAAAAAAGVGGGAAGNAGGAAGAAGGKPAEGQPAGNGAANAGAAAGAGGGGEAKDGQGAKGGTQDGTEGKPDSGKPAKFTPKLPDGFEANPKLVSKLTELVDGEGMKPEAAQALVDGYVELQKEAVEAERLAWEQTKKGWEQEVRKDPELGGARYDETVTLANKVIARFGSPRLVAEVMNSGLGNHPEMVRMLAKIGRGMAEDRIAGTTKNEGGAANSKADREAKLYPTMKK